MKQKRCSGRWDLRLSVLLLAILFFACTGCESAGTEGGGGESSLYAVLYEGNGAESGEPPVDETAYATGAVATVLDSGTLSLPGHAFSGWNSATEGGGDQYAPGDELTIGEEDVILYAQWSPGSLVTIDFTEPEDPEVTFDSAGGTVNRGAPLVVSASSGYMSYAWYVDGVASGQSDALSTEGATATIDTGELGPGPHTLSVVVDGLYSAELPFTVVTG